MAVDPIISTRMIDLSNNTNYIFELVPKGDGQERILEIKIFQNGIPYQLPINSTVTIEGKNAGGESITNNCNIINNNTIRIPLTNGLLTYGGVGKYSIFIYSNDTYVKSFPFDIIVIEPKYSNSNNSGGSGGGDSPESSENTLRFPMSLHPGSTSLSLSGSGNMFTEIDAKGNAFDYHIRFLFSNSKTILKESPTVNIGDNSITSTILFDDNIINEMGVTPIGNENPNNEGWYERSGSTYIITTDTTVNPNKNYYKDILVILEVVKKPRLTT